MKKTYQQQLNEARSEYFDKLSIAWGNDDVRPRELAEAIERTKQLENIARRIERRGNFLLNLALKACGMEDYIGVWNLSFDGSNMPTYSRRLHSNVLSGSVDFVLGQGYGKAAKRWKGNIKDCPLFKVMPLSFPSSWLHASTAQVKREMSVLCAQHEKAKVH